MAIRNPMNLVIPGRPTGFLIPLVNMEAFRALNTNTRSPIAIPAATSTGPDPAILVKTVRVKGCGSSVIL